MGELQSEKQLQKSKRELLRDGRKKKTGNKHIWGHGDGGGAWRWRGCMEDESERPSLLLEAVMGMI